MSPICLLLPIVMMVVGVHLEEVWWKTALVYQIYPRSFKDSNSDGIGDLNGITEKLPYLKDTGVDAIWMSPIFLSPMYDFGYDISDYRQIAPEYGTMEDFDGLMTKAGELGLKVILDFVPNHTSNESEWFTKSAQRAPPYEDYYVWADGTPDLAQPGNTLPPSNWISAFRGSAWRWHEPRRQFYLHQFVEGQPDLNYRNPAVHQEMESILQYWLDKGVSGFRVDAANHMYEADPNQHGGKYPDEPRSNNNADPEDYSYLNHIYTKNQNETYDVVYQWRSVLDSSEIKDGDKLMFIEAYADLDLVMRYYGNGHRKGGIPFNFSFLQELNNQSNAKDIKAVVDKWISFMPSGMTANWVNGNHDQSRLASRHGVTRVDTMNMLALLLPGITITYQGEEIGMTDGYVSWQDTKDPQACNTNDPVNYWRSSRDPARTPFQWNDEENAGFSETTGKPWLPLADSYRNLNLAAEVAADKSHYKFYKDVAALKKLKSVRSGDLEMIALSDTILILTRILQGHPGVIAIANLANTDQVADLSYLREVPMDLEVAASGVDSSLNKREKIVKTAVHLSAHSAVVFQSEVI